MDTTQLLLDHLPHLKLNRLGTGGEAGLLITSLPWPRSVAQHLVLDRQETSIKALGQWPGCDSSSPRRLLLASDCGGPSPKQVQLSVAARPLRKSNPWTASMELFERSPTAQYVWERHLLRLGYHGKTMGLALGLRTAGQVHWWEACSLVVLDNNPQCLEVEMAGAIPCHHSTMEEMHSYVGLSNPYLHRHNWLSGKIHARLHANGVCEILAHHINSKFFDDGLQLEDVVPVVGFVIAAQGTPISPEPGIWDGTVARISVGEARFDVQEVARLATPEQPGSLEQVGKFLVWQPYLGMELYGGICAQERTQDPFHYHAEDRVVPRGMSRTLRFSGSLGDRSPRVVRYLAPAWWYGACEEFLPEALLPVSDACDAETAKAAKWARDHIVRHGFEDGSLPRGSAARISDPTARCEPGWEGEVPYAQFLGAWRTGDLEDYECAMRSAYHFTDVAVDHAAKAVRMHGYPDLAFSVPMNRMQGTIAAYLETGDSHLLETARAVTANSHWTHLNSWPRMAVGRDACYIRSAVLLYRYFGEEFYRQQAHEACLHVAHSQRPNGSFGDQGGGAGIHQWGGYISKPWMGLLALGGVLDYLELFPDSPQLQTCVKKFADWLMSERFDHDGVMGWSYQHEFDGGRQHYCPTTARATQLPSPTLWHQDSFGRLLLYCTLRYDDPSYFEAWVESRTQPMEFGDHSTAASLQFVPWVQAKLWNARLTPEGISYSPAYQGEATAPSAIILTPSGPMAVERTARQIPTPEIPTQPIWPSLELAGKI